MSAIDSALVLAQQGFHVFPCIANAKLPLLKAYPVMASRDSVTIEKWGRKYPGCNFGISTSRFGDDDALVVVDVDTKNGKNGNEAILALELAGFDLPLTLENATPTGGRHLVYTVPAAVKQGVDVLGPGLDIRSQGGYVISPGSVVPAGEYFTDRPCAPVPAPAWLVERCGTPRARSTARTLPPGISPERAHKRAIDYLKTAPEAIQGAAGDHTTFTVAARLKDLGVTQDAAVDLLLEHWFDGCGWTATELAEKVGNAWKYGANAPGADAPEAVFPVVTEVQGEPKQLHPFDEVSREWAIVAEAPHVVVYRQSVDQATGQTVFEGFRKTGFMDLHADQVFEGKPLALAWWASPRRRVYTGGVEFAPGFPLPANVLNLWGGFAVQPAPGDWSLMRAHIRDVICSGDEVLDTYVMNWLARMVQKPGEPGQVALVLRGDRGAGKGTLGEALGDIFGRHSIHLNDPKQLSGQFNGHLAGKVFVFADEAVFAGDKSSTSRLKAMITEKRVPMERKGIDIVEVRNCAHILMASNDSWVVPAGALERRFCVIDVPGSRIDDVAYFGSIRDQMKKGAAAMLHELLARDLSRFNVWDYPHTEAELDQQLATLDGWGSWLHGALTRRRVAGTEWTSTGALVPRVAMHEEYKLHSACQREHHPMGESQFGTRLRKLMSLVGAQIKVKQSNHGDRSAILPPIELARTAFEKFLGRPMVWDG